MLVLKLEQNLFEEVGKLEHVLEEQKGESVFRRIPVDFFDGISAMTVEKKKFPYFYKYYLHVDDQHEEIVELRSSLGTRILLAFYARFCPSYVKNPAYDETIGMNPEYYFHMNLIPGQSMQHFIPGKGSVEEVLGTEPKQGCGYRSLEGYHEFSKEEKKEVTSRLDALKDQFADQLKELSALMGKKVD